jgi:PAS domain S-box-containing protein
MPSATPPVTSGPSLVRLSRAIRLAGILFAIAAPWSARSLGAGPEPVYNTLAFGIEDGLPSNVAEIMVQTRDGYLWVGTEAGLARFNGQEIATFPAATNPELGSNLIRCLAEDASGTLWIGTQRGLSFYRDRRFGRVPGIDVPVADLACDGKAGVWAATLGSGLVEVRDGRVTSHAADPGLPENPQALRLFRDSAGRLWVGFRNGGLAVYENGTFRTEAWADARLGEIVRMGEYPAGTLWIGTDRGIFRRRGGSLALMGPEQGLPRERASCFYTDSDGRFWIATGGLYRADDAGAERFSRVPVPGIDLCRFIMQDREGSYWLGTSGTGIVRMRPSAFRVLLPGRVNIGAIAEEPSGAVWTATVGGDVVRVAPDGSETTLAIPAELRSPVLSLFLDGDRLWIGTRAALIERTGGQFRSYPIANVRVIYRDRVGSLWLGSGNQGAFRIRNGAVEAMGPVFGTGVDSPTAFAEDPSGTLYIGFEQGLLTYRGGRAVPLQPNPAIPDFQVRSILADADGRVWIGTKQHGLVLLEGGHWHDPAPLADALGELVSAVTEDRFGRLWLGTARGVVWGWKRDFLDAENGRNPDAGIRVAGKFEGVEPSSVGYGSQPNTFGGPDGSIGFTTHTGIVVVHPDLIAFNSVVPPVRIERVAVDGVPLPLTGQVELPAGSRRLAIDYTALSFVRPDAVLFRYRLEGHEAGWTEARNLRTAVYTDLKPGRYRFEVTASNNDGVWNRTGDAVSLVQRPRFYQTWWFYALAIVGAAGLAGAIHWRRTAVLRRENERLERGIAERTRELVASEGALRASQEKFSKAFHTQPDSIVIIGLPAGSYVEVNSSFTRAFGYAAEEVQGRTWGAGGVDIWVDGAARDRLVSAAIRGGGVSGVESRFRRKDGTEFAGVVVARAMEIAGEACLLSIIRDVTGQRELQERLQHTQKMEAVGQLAGGVAHDFNNILTSTLMQLGLLLERPGLSPEVLDALRDLERDANRAASLTRQLLTFSRRQMMQVRDAELNGTLEHLFGMLRRLLGEAVDLRFLPSKSPIPISADVGMIEQVVTNLCVNARDAMEPAGGRLEVETRLVHLRDSDLRDNPEARPGLFACIRVSDSGSGMSPETVKHLFEPFFTTKEFGKGTGLGLAIIYGIVKQHQGWIEVETRIGAGTTFRVYLPARESPGAEPPAGTLGARAGSRETILVVEDEDVVRKMVCLALRRCGYRVLEAADGEEAIRIWSENPGGIAMLFSDMVMPKGISGLDLAERFRRDRPDLRVIITSGYSVDLRNAEAVVGIGAETLLKPYDLATLAATVRKCLDRG